MKKILILLFISIVSFLFVFQVKSELLVVKRNKAQEIIALDDFDRRNNQKFVDIFLKYKWPMCLAGLDKINANEKKELFFSDTPRIEEIFIRKKLQEIDKAYDVIFVPDVAYEVFCMYLYFDSLLNQDVDIQAREFVQTCNAKEKGYNFLDVAFLKKSCNSKESYEKFSQFNKEFLQKTFFFVNKKIVKFFKDYKDEKIFFMSFIEQVLNGLFRVGEKCQKLKEKDPSGRYESFDLSTFSCEFFYKHKCYEKGVFSELQALVILCKTVINFEYQAREKNEILLFRGCNPIEIDSLKLLCSPLRNNGDPDDEDYEEKKKVFPDFSFKNNLKNYFPYLYSLSFGNSLFAGFFRDSGAMTFDYLNMEGTLGFVLPLSRKEYVISRCDNLFFVSPFGSLVALFWGRGEFFHSRATCGIGQAQRKTYKKHICFSDNCCNEKEKKKEQLYADFHSGCLDKVEGFNIEWSCKWNNRGDELPFWMFEEELYVIKRNPLKHAIKMFDFFSQNICFLTNVQKRKYVSKKYQEYDEFTMENQWNDGYIECYNEFSKEELINSFKQAAQICRMTLEKE